MTTEPLLPAAISFDVNQAVLALQQGAVIAYPTEAVFGLGCDPDNQVAVQKILEIKCRPVEKGLILLAASLAPLLPYIDYAGLSSSQRQKLLSRQARPTTWLVPVSDKTPAWICGQFNTVAVRITRHPVVESLCQQWDKPLVSTSANYSGEPPALTAVNAAHLQGVDLVLDGALGGAEQTSQILDIKTGALLRP
ncbi:Sua5/YciO/YrdC/YwlC family protein [Agarivorans sp. Z349TD_8]|uniref:Sua5/YciO/YrdC/YwlC family protein n=1 Tax=Agarivorans sp. Z349TD_8 TaxID=3421434 RepID=UPI003D7E4083